MCEVVGQVLSIRTVSVTSIPVTVSSSRITSGTWQEALTIVSKPVRATDTRNPAVLSCASRTSRDAASPSAINTSGATPRLSAGGVATTGGVDDCVRDRGVPFRCTPKARSKNVAQNRGPRLAVRSASPPSAFRASARQAHATGVLALIRDSGFGIGIQRLGIRRSGIQRSGIQDEGSVISDSFMDF
jgi:hypothetical protein